MHPQLRRIAEQYGVPLSERSCCNDYMYDGNTIATNYQKENWDERFEKLLSLSDPIPIPDEWMAHEIAHWVVADPVERTFPEYGCQIGIVPFGANGNLRWDKVTFGSAEYKRMIDFSSGVLTHEEQELREICADFLGVYWCDLIGIPITDDARPLNKCIDSITNPHSAYSVEKGWRAIVWLRERNLIPF